MNIEVKDYTQERTIYLADSIDSETVWDVQNAIQKIIDADHDIFEQNKRTIKQLGQKFLDVYASENKYPPITLIINSPGGTVYDGLGMYDYIRHINDNTDHKVDIVCQGMVASMATIVLLASDNRKAMKNTSFLVHSLFDLMCGKIQDIEDGLAECRRLSDLMSDIYLKHTKLTKAKLKEVDKSKKDWWFGPDKALELGFITEIV